jgi:hypothetical protein
MPDILPDGTIDYSARRAMCPSSVRTVTRKGNRKIGRRVYATARGRLSCPVDCPTWEDCYGQDTTKTGGTLFDNVAASPADNRTPRSFADRPARDATGWRFCVVGDWLNAGAVDHAAIADANAVAAAHAVPSWSYSHAWRPAPHREHVTPELFAFPVRASCETLQDVRDAHAAGWTAAIVIEDHNAPELGAVIDGRRVVLCPAQRDKARTCESCTSRGPLCALPVAVVAFAKHGAHARRNSREHRQEVNRA